MARICPRCGSEIPANQSLCPACLFGEGLKVETIECTKCHNVLAEEARFCPQCGAIAPAAAVEAEPVRAALSAKLGAQYRIVRLLGRGGMGAVYLARDLTLDREVAIKVVNTATDDRSMYERFRREAKTAAKLSHPNIVPLYAFGEVEGTPYFVMGYVRGESLADRLAREGRIPEDEARRVLGEIADALDHAHRQGVVHRDIKPDNVLLDDETGRALLTDFGVARAFGKGETMTQFGSVIGTPQYMSPEQAAGRGDIDGRSDLYSLGVMGYAMLAGRLPFEGDTAADILTKHITQEPAPLRSLAPAVSDSTVQVLERCLTKDPAARWPDARSLKLALGATDESSLPDDLQAVESHGILGAAIAALLLLIVWLLKAPRFAILLNAAIVAAIYVAVVVRVRIAGFRFRDSQRAIWTEPPWWPLWYPRSLRRRGNVWDRLPAVVRQFRAWNTALLAAFLLLFLGEFPNAFRSPGAFFVKVGGMAIFVIFGAILRVRATHDLKRSGLRSGDIRRVVISIPPSRVAFWARPHIAAILAPTIQPETNRRLESPHDQMQSIIRLANELSGPLRPLGAQAAVAARQLVESIEHLDRQIADLARNLEPGEEERLADKIEVLAGVEEYASMRSLLERQRELVREMSARIEEAKERRNRRVEMLRTLALHMASLRARQAATPSEVGVVSDEVRGLCDEIQRQAESLSDREQSAADDMQTIGRPAKSTP